MSREVRRSRAVTCKVCFLKCDTGNKTKHIFPFNEIWTRKKPTTIGLQPLTTLFEMETECEYIHSKGTCPLFRMAYLSKSYNVSVVSYLTWNLGVTFFMNHPVLVHLFSFAFGQCSITIRRQIRQFVIERNTSINSTTDCPISKTDWTLVIVNWTLCTTFGISKSVGQWAVSFITLVRMWEVPCQTVWNECRIVLKICHSLRTMLKFCWMTNWNQISPNCYAHRPISLHQLLGEVPSFAPVLNQFWRLATSNCKKVY